MYRIALVRPGQPVEHRTGTTGGDIRDALWDLLRSQNAKITDDDHSHLIAMCGAARDMADIDGFAALQLDGGAALTIRPGDKATVDNCPDCVGTGAHTACEGEGCTACDPTTGNCPTCAGSGNNPERWMRYHRQHRA